MYKSAIIMRSAHTKRFSIAGILDPDVVHYTDLVEFGEAYLRNETPDIKVVCKIQEGTRWAMLTVKFPDSFMRFNYEFYKSESFDISDFVIVNTHG
jgi:hypothetical protein